MARAGLQSRPGLARPTLRSSRCSCGWSASQAWPPLVRPWGWSQTSDQEKTPQQGDQGQEGDVPILGVRKVKMAPEPLTAMPKQAPVTLS